jgi:hypothetical protein
MPVRERYKIDLSDPRWHLPVGLSELWTANDSNNGPAPL